MSVTAKICGVNSPDAIQAAVDGGAAFVGLNFYPPSPRAVGPAEAADLLHQVPDSIISVGVFVDPDDTWIDAVLAAVPLQALQFHGAEPPARIADIGARTKRRIIKAISVAEAADLDRATAYTGIVDWLMFDAKPPKDMKNPLPGGNAVRFDWTLLARRQWTRPWLLAGGIDAGNLAEAVTQSGASIVDTSSGVEDKPGVKNPDKIRAFLAAAAAL